MRVLLVDDEIELVTTLAERLALRDIEADWATTGPDALRLAHEHTYDIAVLDVKIPNTSGLDLKKQIEEVQPDLRFIFVTGHGSRNDFERGVLEAGAEYYMVKPISLELLIERMNDSLKQPERGAEDA
jgi:DNA-binding response OmpR family regulator